MKTSVKFEYTNTCTCEDYNEETDTTTPSNDCWGYCWDYVIDDFNEITKHLFDKNETNFWRVSNLRLWHGDVGGFFQAKNVSDLIKGMTVNSEWIMNGEVFDDRIEYSLSHHDAPMGSSTVLSIVSEEEREKYGLY